MNRARTAIEVDLMLGDNITFIVYESGSLMFETPLPSLDGTTLQ